MDNKKKEKLFARFIAGVSSHDDEQEMLKISAIEQQMINQWETSSKTTVEAPSPNLFRVLSAVYKRIGFKPQPEKRIKDRSISILQRVAAIAAVFVFLLSVGIILWNEGVILGKDIVTVTAPKGVRIEVFLPDGSRVWLNSQSTISYNKHFDADKREIKLEGEAFFNISKDSARPLLVRTDIADVEVLGTRFNVSSKRDKSQWQATLVSGKVKIHPKVNQGAKTISLAPGQKALWNSKKQEMQVNSVNVDVDARWVSNQLRFDNETFGSIVKQIELTFGVKVIIPVEMEQKYRFTAKFTDESVYEIFSLLQRSAPFQFRIQGNSVIVSALDAKR